MATALERGQTVANNKIDVKLPGEGSFEVPEKNKGSTGFSWGPHIAKPTGSHGGLSHVQKQAQAQSWAMRAKNRPKSVIKNSGVNKNMLDQEGFEAQIRRMVMVPTPSSTLIQSAYHLLALIVMNFYRIKP